MSGALIAVLNCGAKFPVADWANISGVSPATNADKTMSAISSLTLRATISGGSYGAGAKALGVYRNGSIVGSAVTAADGATVDARVVAGDTIHYEATKGVAGSGTSWSGTVTVTVLETGFVVDTFTVSVNAAA